MAAFLDTNNAGVIRLPSALSSAGFFSSKQEALTSTSIPRSGRSHTVKDSIIL